MQTSAPIIDKKHCTVYVDIHVVATWLENKTCDQKVSSSILGVNRSWTMCLRARYLTPNPSQTAVAEAAHCCPLGCVD